MSELNKSNAAQSGKGFLVAGILAAVGASGVTDAKVDFDKKTASVSFDPDRTNPAELTKATVDAGYPSSVRN